MGVDLVVKLGKMSFSPSASERVKILQAQLFPVAKGETAEAKRMLVEGADIGYDTHIIRITFKLK